MPTLFDISIPEPLSDERSGYKLLEAFDRGVNSARRTTLIRETEFTVGKNIKIDEDRVEVDLGYAVFGQASVRGNARVAFQFFMTDGTSELVLITDDTFYKWNATNTEWEYVSDGVKTTLDANEASGQTEISVAATAGFSVNDFVGITLNDGTQHRSTIASISAGVSITINDALPSAADSGNAFVKAVDLAGNSDKGVSIAVWAAVDRMYFANGVDTPKQFDGTDVTDISNLPGTTFACHVVAVFNDRLILMNTTEDGTAHPQRVRWSQAGDPTAWNSGVNFNDLVQTEDFIVAAVILANVLVIYKERSVWLMEAENQPTRTWNFEQRISGEGALSVDSVVDLNDYHVLFGNANVYEYRGGFDLEPIGDNIFTNVFGAFGDLNPARITRSFALYVEETDEIWFVYPATGQDFPKKMARLKLQTNAWTFRDFNDNITGFGFFQTSATRTWAALKSQGLKWQDVSFAWNSKQLSSNSPTILLCSTDTDRTFEYDYIVSSDNGVAIPYVFETGDYYVPNFFLRFNRYEMELKGTGISVFASYNEGTSYELLGTVSPGSIYKRQRFWKQRTGRSIRFRITGNGPGFALRWIGFDYKIESSW